MAHELNNPISFVLGNVHALNRYTQRLRQYLEAVHAALGDQELPELRKLARQFRIEHILNDLPSLMDGTIEGAQRTASIVDGLKGFSALDGEERETVAMDAVVERAIHWVKKGMKLDFDVQFQRCPGCTVRGNAGQLLQVLMNLIQNAYDAASSQGACCRCCASPRARSLAGWPSRCTTTGRVLRPRRCRTCSSPFSPPSRWARAQGWACPSATALWSATAASSWPATIPRAGPSLHCGCLRQGAEARCITASRPAPG